MLEKNIKEMAMIVTIRSGQGSGAEGRLSLGGDTEGPGKWVQSCLNHI
jgi:hypothetical protein